MDMDIINIGFLLIEREDIFNIILSINNIILNFTPPGLNYNFNIGPGNHISNNILTIVNNPHTTYQEKNLSISTFIINLLINKLNNYAQNNNNLIPEPDLLNLNPPNYINLINATPDIIDATAGAIYSKFMKKLEETALAILTGPEQ